MENVQISPCGFICEREKSWCQQILGWKYGHFETPTPGSKTDILAFLENKRLFERPSAVILDFFSGTPSLGNKIHAL